MIIHDRAERRLRFAHKTFSERYPRILQRTLREDSDADLVAAIGSLSRFIAGETPLNIPRGLEDATWQALYQAHEGSRATEIDFLTLEYLVFHEILLAHRYFEQWQDPFASDKRLDLGAALPTYARAFDGLTDLKSALMVSLLGNAHDASQLNINSDGRVLDLDPLPGAVDREFVDIICDNAGHEYLSDLVLAAYLLRTTNSVVRLHVKAMPWFVSDATMSDALGVFEALETAPIRATELGTALLQGRESGRLEFLDGPQWTRPINYGEGNLVEALGSPHSMVIVKGDLNYRRCIGDASTDIFTPWQSLPYLPDVDVLSLRSVKSHCWAGVDSDKFPPDLDGENFPMDGALFCAQAIPSRETRTPA